MITATQKFIDTLAYSHESLTRVTVDGIVAPIASGNLTCDWSRNVRRSGSVRVVDDVLTPTLVPSITTASTVVIEKGIRYLDTATEYVTVATMRVQDYKRSMSGKYIDLVLSDDGQLVDDYPIIFPWSPTSAGVSMLIVDAIKELVEEALPTVPTWNVDLDAGPAAMYAADGIMYAAGSGRWNAINELGFMIAAEVHAEVDGSWTIKQVRPTSTPVYSIVAGVGGTLVDATGSASRRNTNNGIAIEWGTTEVPGAIILVTDDDAASPTYWLGPWGKRPASTVKLAVTTEAEAIASATAMLQKSKGTQSGLELTAAYNPLLEPGDVVGVRQKDQATEYHILDSFSYDLLNAVMSASTRVVIV